MLPKVCCWTSLGIPECFCLPNEYDQVLWLPSCLARLRQAWAVVAVGVVLTHLGQAEIWLHQL